MLFCVSLPSLTNSLYNAPLLLMLRPLKKRLIATLLPLSFLWAFVTCVSICERETLAIHPPTTASCATEINAIRDLPECDGCPLSYFPKATTPERVKSIHAVQSLSSFAPATLSIYFSQRNVFADRLDSPLSTTSPPLRALSPLRI
jgi:hypothetical protein